MAKRAENPASYHVQVLDRAFAMLDALAQARDDASLAEIAALVHMHKSTVHRLLMVLEQHRAIDRDPSTGRYRLGMRLFELGNIAVGRFDIRARARPHLEKLMHDTNETVHLCVLDHGEVLYLDKVEPSRSVRMASTVGHRNPMHCTSVGKAILAGLPEEEVDDVIRRHGLRRMTANTIVTPVELKRELLGIRERGYSIDNEENEEGVRCVGAAVKNHLGCSAAAVSVSAPAFRLSMEIVPVIASAVVQTANSISSEWGYRDERADAVQKPITPLLVMRQVK
jgi:DNA-binding IclR family transcriptional regulator